MSLGLGNISISGSALLGGMGGKIDTDALVDALMQAKSIPQKRLQLQVEQQAKIKSAYQGINSTLSRLASAAESLMDNAGWIATKASSSSSAVSATSTATAPTGSSTFDITQLASAQISTIVATDGDVVDFDQTPSLTLNVGGEAHTIDLESGSATDVAKAINDANVGVRAAVVNTDQGQVLQLTGSKTGAENAFSSAELSGMNDLVAAQDAMIAVGTMENNGPGYTISSSTNTFKDAMPGVTFTASKVEDNVTVSVASDNSKAAALVKSMVDAVNSSKLAIRTYTDEAQLLQGDSMVVSFDRELSNVFSGISSGGTALSQFGIELTKGGLVDFDAAVFNAAYKDDPTGTMEAISEAMGSPVRQIADGASLPITGSLSQAITALDNKTTDLTGQIAKWGDRLDAQRTQLTIKYGAMQTAMAKLESQSSWLTSMFDSINGKKD